MAEIGKLAKEKGVIFHTDATQAVGKIPVDVEAMGIDLLSSDRPQDLRPQGRRRAVRAAQEPAGAAGPQMDGGGHERGMRSGTLTVPLVVGFGKAARDLPGEMAEESKRLAALRDRLQEQIVSKRGRGLRQRPSRPAAARTT